MSDGDLSSMLIKVFNRLSIKLFTFKRWRLFWSVVHFSRNACPASQHFRRAKEFCIRVNIWLWKASGDRTVIEQMMNASSHLKSFEFEKLSSWEIKILTSRFVETFMFCFLQKKLCCYCQSHFVYLCSCLLLNIFLSNSLAPDAFHSTSVCLSIFFCSFLQQSLVGFLYPLSSCVQQSTHTSCTLPKSLLYSGKL